MRSVVMLVLGLVIGAICTTMALRALSEGSEYPKGVMALMGAHYGAVRQALEAGECEAGAMARHAATLRLVAHDIEPAFLPTGGDDQAFAAHAAGLRDEATALEQVAGSGCAALSEAAAAVGQACKACHQEFR
jgi:hypothetical protein